MSIKEWIARLSWRLATWTGCKDAWQDGFVRGTTIMREQHHRQLTESIARATASGYRAGYAQAKADMRDQAQRVSVN